MSDHLTITIELDDARLVNDLLSGTASRASEVLALTIDDVRSMLGVPITVGHKASVIATRREQDHILAVMNRPNTK